VVSPRQTIEQTKVKLILALLLISAVASAERVPIILELAKVNHSCGAITYTVPKKKARNAEVRALRKIVSYFWDGARVMLTSEDQPRADFNEASRKYMLASSILQKEHFSTLSGEALDKKVREIHDLMPSDWHVHVGPKFPDIQKIILSPKMRKKLGTKSIELFNKSATGKAKARDDFFRILEDKYEFESHGNIAGDENCKIGPDLSN
jgi:hypothetical protein